MINPKIELIKTIPHCACYKGKFKTGGKILIHDGALVFEADNHQISLFGLVGGAISATIN